MKIDEKIVKRCRELESSIFSIENQTQFESLALELFTIHAQHSPIYREYVKLLDIDIGSITSIEKIPFLPISLFKEFDITLFNGDPQLTFLSSATTGTVPSRHLVKSEALYRRSYLTAFREALGEPKEFTILALLPSYLERSNSSLVNMVKGLVDESNSPHSGFYLYNHQELYEKLEELRELGEKTLLIGVTFALLDFIEQYKINFPQLIVVETGGMKGRREELSREEVHQAIGEAFSLKEESSLGSHKYRVYSEYGMAELLSQSWSKGGGLFRSPPWKRVLIRDPLNPLSLLSNGREGGVNIIDLANLYSAPFIESEDMGVVESSGHFRVTGRLSSAEIRGCNLLL